MAEAIEENVFRLHVSVNEAHGMQGVQSQCDFGEVESCQLLVEGAVADHQAEQVTAGKVLHDEVQVLAVLEAVLEPRNPLALPSEDHDVSLLLHLAVVDQRFLDRLHCVYVGGAFFGHQLQKFKNC